MLILKNPRTTLNCIRIITCSPYRAHTEPLFYANKILNIKDINFYVVSVFMYNCVSSPLPGILQTSVSQTMSSTGMIIIMQMTCMFLDWTLENLVWGLMVQIHGRSSQMLLSNPYLSVPLDTGLENAFWVWNVAKRILKPRFSYCCPMLHCIFTHNEWQVIMISISNEF